MSATRRDREQFLADCARHGMLSDDARLFMRYAAKLQRLGEWGCNEEWYCNPKNPRKCTVCEQDRPRGYVYFRTVKGKALRDVVCQECRTEELAHILAKKISNTTGPVVTVTTQGDPRGCLITLVFGDREVGVPS